MNLPIKQKTKTDLYVQRTKKTPITPLAQNITLKMNLNSTSEIKSVWKEKIKISTGFQNVYQQTLVWQQSPLQKQLFPKESFEYRNNVSFKSPQQNMLRDRSFSINKKVQQFKKKLFSKENQKNQGKLIQYEKRVEAMSERFENIKYLGEGNNAIIFQVQDKSDKNRYVLKMEKNYQGQIRQEFQILNGLTHPRIVKAHSFFTILNHQCILLDYLGNENLQTFKNKNLQVQKQSTFQVSILMQLLDSLVYLHENGLFHGDIKMENVMVWDKQAFLIDFGFSSNKNSTPENIVFGSMGYMSPELLKGIKFDPQKNDVWAFGVLAHKLITNKFPFIGSTFDEIHRKIKQTLKLNLNRIENNTVKALIQLCLIQDEQKWPSFQKIKEILKTNFD